MAPKKPLYRRLEWVLALLITVGAVLLHFYYWIHVGGLWRDEINFINLSHGRSLADMARDSFPILSLLAMHAWEAMGLGRSDLTLRLFGLLVGLGMVAALWLSSWKIRRAPPLYGLVLFGLNSTLFFFGDSLRAYGLGSLLALALTASAFFFIQRPSRWRAVCLGVFAVLSVQVLYHNAVMVAAVCFGGWAVCWRRKNARAALQILLVAVIAAASLLPYAHSLMVSGNNSLVLRSGLDLSRFRASYQDLFGFPQGFYTYIWIFFYLLIVYLACISFCKTSSRFFERIGIRNPADQKTETPDSCSLSQRERVRVRESLPDQSPIPVHGKGRGKGELFNSVENPVPVYGEGELSPAEARGSEQNPETPPTVSNAFESASDFNLFAAVMLTVAMLGFPIFFWRSQMPMQSWYLLPLMAGAVVCFDATLPVAFARGLLRGVFLLFIAATAALSLPETGKIVEGHFSSMNIYARHLTAEAAPGDYIILVPWFMGLTFDHYFQGTTPWDTLPPLPDHSTHRFDLVQRQLENTNAIAPVLAKINRTLASGHRVWILALPGWMGVPRPGLTPPPALPPAPLPKTGWADWPYTSVWAAQVACALANHSQFQQIQSLSSERFITEPMNLYLATGWRTNAAGR